MPLAGSPPWDAALRFLPQACGSRRSSRSVLLRGLRAGGLLRLRLAWSLHANVDTEEEVSDRSNENPILDPGGSIAEQLAAKDAEIERKEKALTEAAEMYDGACARANGEKARADKAEAELKGVRETLAGTEQGVEFLHARVEEAKDERDAAEARAEKAERELERWSREHENCYFGNPVAELQKKLDTENARVAKLTEALREAPHDLNCLVSYAPPMGGCSCWKAAALEEEK